MSKDYYPKGYPYTTEVPETHAVSTPQTPSPDPNGFELQRDGTVTSQTTSSDDELRKTLNSILQEGIPAYNGLIREAKIDAIVNLIKADRQKYANSIKQPKTRISDDVIPAGSTDELIDYMEALGFRIVNNIQGEFDHFINYKTHEWLSFDTARLIKADRQKYGEQCRRKGEIAGRYSVASSITTDRGDAYYQSIQIQRYAEQLKAAQEKMKGASNE